LFAYAKSLGGSSE